MGDGDLITTQVFKITGKTCGKVYHGISLAWYVPQYTCLYCGILMILFFSNSLL